LPPTISRRQLPIANNFRSYQQKTGDNSPVFYQQFPAREGEFVLIYPFSQAVQDSSPALEAFGAGWTGSAVVDSWRDDGNS